MALPVSHIATNHLLCLKNNAAFAAQPCFGDPLPHILSGTFGMDITLALFGSEPSSHLFYPLQAKNAVARAERLAKLAQGVATGSAKRTEAVRAVGKKFYKTIVVDSEYQGEDFAQFSSFLQAPQKGEEVEAADE